MSVAALHRLLTAAAVAAAVAAAAYLHGAWSDEKALSEAGRALQRGDTRTALGELRDVGDGATVKARAAALEARAALLRGDLQGATARLAVAVRERPNDWRLRRDLAVGLAALGDVEGARGQALRTLHLNPRATLPSSFNVRSGGR